ncbi:hypothetical protein V2J09_005447 [Rumex salicifolius]
MEENKGDFQGNVGRPSSLRPLKQTLSGRSTPTMSPRGSPSFRRLNSCRTPRREGKSGALLFQCFRSDKIVYWLLLITLWTYGGFYFQSRWAHNDNQEGFIGLDQNRGSEAMDSEQNHRRGLASDKSVDFSNGTDNLRGLDVRRMSNNVDVAVKRKGKMRPSLESISLSKKRNKRGKRGSRSPRREKGVQESEDKEVEVQEEQLPNGNVTYGFLVGPFGAEEDRILEWSPEKRTGTCDRNELFAKLVWSRNFMLIFHELSMTGAPLSMLEFATELLSCGATVQAVVLSRKGGLMPELLRRRIKLLDDKAEHSFKAAMKVDLIIAGSAVCASWIEKYLQHFAAGSNQIAWWIMENRREYFDRSKLVLNRVKMLIFLSELQSKQWLTWCEEEKIKLTTQISLIPLSVNDELAFAAGIPCSLNTPRFNPERMLEKKQILRKAIREQMGLKEDDMLVLALSSINSAKGQLLLVESAHLVIGEESSKKNSGVNSLLSTLPDRSILTKKLRLRGLLRKANKYGRHSTAMDAKERGLSDILSSKNNTDTSIINPSSNQENPRKSLKILIGSVGSKSNKILYVKEIIKFVSDNQNLSKSVLWTPSTTRVASLYSAADAYVINSQGLGETFGRVTIEAMAFGLPVLGTDSGGTKEIVDHNITGLLHPVGRPGTEALANNIKFLLKNPSVRKLMGTRGREKVERMYLKRHMYKMFFEVFFKCMRIK